jgi:hypothetical protein
VVSFDARACLGSGLTAVLLACSTPAPAKFPAREPGCEVQIFPDAPSYATENIGAVHASCEESVSDADCLRTLKDAACKLGADTVWGMSETPKVDLGRKKFSGRAAHQK